DNDGNIFISAPTLWNIVTFKYDSNGNELWAASYADDENSRGRPNAITSDDYGNVYIAGCFSSLGKRSDYLIIKYNAIGAEQWVAKYDGTVHSFDVANAIAVDESGNVYITGSSTNSNTGKDYATIKYSADGVQQWLVCYNGTGDSQDQAYDIAVSQFGNIFVTGNSGTIKYNGEGAFQWIDSTMIASKIIVDEMENCYGTGKNTAKINSDGNVEWIASITGNGRSIAVDDSGYVYVAGSTTREGQGSNITTTKLDFDGNIVWFAEYNGPINSTDIATALSIDDYGNIYVTGNSGSYTGYDFATIKYDPCGEEQWVARYDSTGFYDETAAIAVDDLGNVYVAGTSYEMVIYDLYWSVVTTIKYSQTSTSIEQEMNIVPRTFYLSQNYPNPFNPTTTIRYALPKDSYVTLKVFNLLGQELATLVDEMKLMGEHRIPWQAVNLPSGVYLYQLEANSNDGSLFYFNETKKFILLK
ncbi:MAG: SBBP repeat-containing protein, partial [bacterium]